MSIEIKHLHTGAVLRTVEGDTLCDAKLRWDTLSGADLYGADLRGALLTGADLYGADLRGATLPDGRTVIDLMADYTDTDREECQTDE